MSDLILVAHKNYKKAGFCELYFMPGKNDVINGKL
jgi:hypothetical protein